ncbi:hypothetical protein QTN25_007588 [Entamoeba marina]
MQLLERAPLLINKLRGESVKDHVPSLPEVISENVLFDCNNLNSDVNEELNVTKYLEKWSGLKVESVLFDSDRHGEVNTDFNRRVLNKSNLYFVHIDEDQNVFGAFIKKPITTDRCFIEDENSFLFSFSSNNRLTCPTKFNTKGTNTKYSFYLFRESMCLYQIGGYGRINVCKTTCQKSFL